MQPVLQFPLSGCGITSIFQIADYRSADMGKMRPKLVGSAGNRPEGNPAKPVGSGFDHGVMRDRAFGHVAPLLRNHHALICTAWSESRLFLQCKANGSAEWPWHAFAQGPIGFPGIA